MICRCLFVLVCEEFIIRSRYSVVGGDNTRMEYEMTILCPYIPIALRHQWNRIVSGYCELALMNILCHQLDVKPHVFIARDRRIIHNNISSNKLVCQTN